LTLLAGNEFRITEHYATTFHSDMSSHAQTHSIACMCYSTQYWISSQQEYK